MNNIQTPNSNPNNNSDIKSRIDFWVGVVVGYESQKDQIENGLGWRYKVRIIGENSDNDQVKDAYAIAEEYICNGEVEKDDYQWFYVNYQFKVAES